MDRRDSKPAAQVGKVGSGSVVARAHVGAVKTYRITLAVSAPAEMTWDALSDRIEQCLQSHYSGMKANVETVEQTS